LSFNKLNLHPNLLKAIDACGFDKPTDNPRTFNAKPFLWCYPGAT